MIFIYNFLTVLQILLFSQNFSDQSFYYAPVEGKKLVIRTAFPSPEEFYDLRHKYGFTGIVVYDTLAWNEALIQGFEKKEIIGAVDRRNGYYPDCDFTSYYLDEPVENNLTSADVIKLSEEIKSRNKNAVLYICSFQDNDAVITEYKKIIQNTDNTIIMCDQYYDGSVFCGHDQRSWWTNFSTWYPGRSDAHWVHLLVDGIQDDFDILFDQANNLDVKSLWLYTGDAESSWIFCIDKKLDKNNYYEYLDKFAEAAWRNGWLKKVNK